MGKVVEVENIELNKGKPRVIRFLRNVMENYSDVIIHLRVEDNKINIKIDEVIRIENHWRLTTFITHVDMGSEKLEEPIEVILNQPEEEEEQN